MMIRLQHSRPDGEVDTYYLKPGRKYHIGRGSACEIRVLDLKLSRKHCVIEYGDGAWRIEDLCSTNGCRIGGEQIVGKVALAAGVAIEAGQTRLTVTEISDNDRSPSRGSVIATPANGMPTGKPPASTRVQPSAPAPAGRTTTPAKVPVTPNLRTPLPSQVQQEDMPEDGDAHEPQANDADFEPVTETLNRTDALLPNAEAPNPHAGKGAIAPVVVRRGDSEIRPSPLLELELELELEEPGPSRALERTPPPAQSLPPESQPEPLFIDEPAVLDQVPARQPPARIKPVTIRVGRSDLPDLTPLGTPMTPVGVPSLPDALRNQAPSWDPASAEDRAFFITVLGRRVGPLSRSAARDLKTRELKGVLTAADLETYPKA